MTVNLSYYDYLYYLDNILGTSADPTYDLTNEDASNDSSSSLSFAELNLQGKDTLEVLQ